MLNKSIWVPKQKISNKNFIDKKILGAGHKQSMIRPRIDLFGIAHVKVEPFWSFTKFVLKIADHNSK